jgi:ABC-type dipeptide/oligopeptide/nickel transport system permease subunit
MFGGVIRQKNGAVGVVIAAVVIAAALVGPIVTPYDPYEIRMSESLRPPSWSHPFGTDVFGRDVMGRLVLGARVSLEVSVLSRLISILIGTALGLAAGYFGGRLDNAVMRAADVTLAYPGLLLLVAVMAAVGPSLLALVVALGLVGWAAVARIVRAQVLSVRERDFIVAVHSLGGGPGRIIVQHVLPNCVSQLVIVFSMGLGMGIMAESSMSFLGLGAQPPLPSWGSMVSGGLDYLRVAPWMSLAPGIGITIAVLGFNLLGDACRDVLDPRLSRSRRG